MKREIKLDPFFDKQPPLKFLELLRKPVHGERISSFRKREAGEDEALADGAYISIEFSENKGLLKTAYEDFRKFLDVYGISGNKYPIKIKFGNTGCFESHRISIMKEGAVIKASDTEGVRRALIWIEDEYRRREGPCLPVGVVARSPHIRSRITRCFFSPINRPPKYGDELSDDVDYYPDEYLNRLAHDGTNGVWIYTRFSDLVYSSFIEENGTGSEARIAKLNKVIAKCARYGIKVYVFAIEPMAFTDAKMSEKYPQVLGNSGSGRGYGKAFCTNTEFGRKYCVEAVKSLFKLAPGLGGFIDITMGERLTACASGFTTIKCPNCGNMPAGQVLAQTVDVLREGMREVAPEADFISWTYGHRYWDFGSIRDYVKHVPDDACVMQNFDDMLYEEQLGKTRLGVDYWLACAGPSELFHITAEEARKQSKKLFAKMQVCCSHELASVPYIPVPGILYKKYAEAFKYGVEGVMQCWYFGNYPSLMSKAAGELAFEPSFNDEEGFLRRLAGITWGGSAADDVVAAWGNFEAGYSQYPLNVMFSYYGPMHDGPVWELQLKPKNFSLPRTWQTLDPTDGDRIGEALLSGHTLEEALTLTGRISENWGRGLEILNSLEAADDERREQQSVAAALGILFDSGHNILEFYLRRDMLGRGIEPEDNLDKMRKIVLREIKNSRELTAFCSKDPRLGYHSEGEGFKFFPEKLEHRIAQLERLLASEFPETADRIEKGLPPLEYYCGVEEGAVHYHMGKASPVASHAVSPGASSEAVAEASQAASPEVSSEAASPAVVQAASAGTPPGAPTRTLPLKAPASDNDIFAGSPCEYLSDHKSFFRAAYDDDHLYIELYSPEKATFTLSPEFRLMWPDPTILLSPDGSVSLGKTAFMNYSVFGEKEKRELSKWKKVDRLSKDNTHLIVTLNRKDISWTENRPFKLRIATGGGRAGAALWCREEEPVRTLGKPELSPGEFGFMIP